MSLLVGGLFCFQIYFSNIALGETFGFYDKAIKGRKEEQSMRNALDRRQQMLELLSDRRFEIVRNLMQECNFRDRDSQFLVSNLKNITVNRNVAKPKDIFEGKRTCDI